MNFTIGQKVETREDNNGCVNGIGLVGNILQGVNSKGESAPIPVIIERDPTPRSNRILAYVITQADHPEGIVNITFGKAGHIDYWEHSKEYGKYQKKLKDKGLW